MINKYVKIKHVCDSMNKSFLGSGYRPKAGDILMCKEVASLGSHIGVVSILHGGREYKIDKGRSGCWSFFTEGMVTNKIYALEIVYEVDYLQVMGLSVPEKVVHQSAGDVGVSRCDSAKSYLDAYGKKPLEQRYNEWILENIHVYDLFCKFTLQAIQSGRKKISHWLIVNRLRWEVEIETKGLCEEDKEYKISNDYIAFLARDFIKDHPEHESIFNLKQMKRV